MTMLPVNRTNALLLTILTQIKALHHTQQVHAKVILHGLQEEVLLGSSLTNSYIQSNRLDLAAASFHRIPPRKRNRYSWNTILSGHSKSKNHRESLRLYNLMRKDCNVDSFNLVFAIKACVGLGFSENGVLVHGLAVKNGLDKDDYVAPSLVEMYGEFGRMEDARKVFDEITLKSSVLWGVLMKGYLRYSRDSEVFRLFYLMREGGLGIDNALTLICLVKACGNVFAGREGKSVHGLSIRRGFIDQSGYLQASVVDMYVECRLLDDAREVFQKSVDKNVVMWTTLVSGFAKYERAVEAFDLFREMMLGERVLPNQCTLAAVLVACSSLGSQRHGRSVHGYMLRNGIEMDAVNFTSFIDMYARCGNVQMARKVFDMMPERNVISWSSMVNAFGINGKFEEALGCFGKMKSQNLTPNSVTFVSLLSACSHSGNIEEGRKQFVSMTRDYGIAPEEEHYACMVDLLGRGGEIGEAKSFIDNMPVEPMASAWGALLNACRIHKKVELAEEIAEKLLSMGSNESSVYVLLSNIYADAGMWEMVNSVRRKMGIKGYRKPMGLSAIERLRAVINELESLKPEFHRRVDELNRADDEPYSVVGSGFPVVSYSSDAVEWPPVNRASYFRPGDINKPALPTSQTSGAYNSKPIVQQFQKLSFDFLPPNQATLSRHSFLGPNGLKPGPALPSLEEKEGSNPYQHLHVPVRIMEDFLRLARSNTERNLVTLWSACWLSEKQGVSYHYSHNSKAGVYLRFCSLYLAFCMYSPVGDSSHTWSILICKKKYSKFRTDSLYFPWVWIHTHPTQTCFMSSVVFHTHYSYQIMLPEAVAIVMAPTDETTPHGIFHLSDPSGVSVIRNCQQRGFHPHEESEDGNPIYEHCSHVFLNAKLEYEVLDLR
ncbi:unnamed protein product [Brassica oleracea]